MKNRYEQKEFKMRKLLWSAWVLSMLLAGALAAIAQDGQMDAEQAAMMNHMVVGPEHAALAELTGTWKAQMKFWMEPGAEPGTGTGTSTYEMIMGGRILKGTHIINMVGMPMTMNGLSLETYDNTRKLYNMIWTDDLSTGITFGEGKFDSKVMTTTGKMTDPMIGGAMEFRTVTKVESKDKKSMEMYVIQNGQEVKMFEILYERVP